MDTYGLSITEQLRLSEARKEANNSKNERALHKMQDTARTIGAASNDNTEDLGKTQSSTSYMKRFINMLALSG